MEILIPPFRRPPCGILDLSPAGPWQSRKSSYRPSKLTPKLKETNPSSSTHCLWLSASCRASPFPTAAPAISIFKISAPYSAGHTRTTERCRHRPGHRRPTALVAVGGQSCSYSGSSWTPHRSRPSLLCASAAASKPNGNNPPLQHDTRPRRLSATGCGGIRPPRGI